MSICDKGLREELFEHVNSLKWELRACRCLESCFVRREERNLAGHTAACEERWVRYWNSLLDLFRD